jgi:hypothetical protein
VRQATPFQPSTRNCANGFAGRGSGTAPPVVRTVAEVILIRIAPTPSLDTAKLIDAFAPLGEWEYWTRDQKRSVLSALVPDIRVADYEVESLGLNPSAFSNNGTRTAAGYFITTPQKVYLPVGFS